MTSYRKTRWAVHLGSFSALVVLVSGLTGCGGSEAQRCEELFSSSIGAVAGVESVEVDCRVQLGGGWERVSVHLATSDEDEAREIGRSVLRAVAEEPEMDPQWSTPQGYFLQDGTEASIDRRELGFNGVPTVGEVREVFDIQVD